MIKISASNLAEKNCGSCKADSPKISDEELNELIILLPGWIPIDRSNVMMLERVYKFRSFKEALAFTNEVAQLAEVECHHPSILLEWGKVTVTWWTHSISGLHMNDFICAAKTNVLSTVANC